MVHRSSFLYSGTDKICMLTGRFPPGTFSPEYEHYIKDKKEKQIKDCYYKKIRNQEAKYSEAKRKCKLEGGYVLEINSKDENDLVKDYLMMFLNGLGPYRSLVIIRLDMSVQGR